MIFHGFLVCLPGLTRPGPTLCFHGFIPAVHPSDFTAGVTGVSSFAELAEATLAARSVVNVVIGDPKW